MLQVFQTGVTYQMYHALGLGQARLRLSSGLGVINVAGPPLAPRPNKRLAASV